MEKEKVLKYGFIGHRIKEIRKELNISQERLAKKFNTSQGKISWLEKNGSSAFTNKIYEYFYSRGYNINWIVIKKNENINKKLTDS